MFLTPGTLDPADEALLEEEIAPQPESKRFVLTHQRYYGSLAVSPPPPFVMRKMVWYISIVDFFFA